MIRMNVYYETDYGDELYHAGNGNGNGQRKNHKYIARVREGNHYRYFYSQAEITAYNAAKAVGGAARAAGNAVANTRVGRAIGIGLESKLEQQKKDYETKDDLYNMAVRKWQKSARPGNFESEDLAKKTASAEKYATDADNAAEKYNKTLDTYNKSLIKKAKDAKTDASIAVGTRQRSKMNEAKKELEEALSYKGSIYDARRKSDRAHSEYYRKEKTRRVAEAKAKYEHFQRLYADTPLGKIEGAANSIRKGASQVAKTVSKVGSQAVSTITSGGSKLLNAGKSLLSGLFGKKKK